MTVEDLIVLVIFPVYHVLSGIILFRKFFVLGITFVNSGLCIPNMVYLVQFVCLSDGVNLKVVATSIAEIERTRPVYHDVRNSMPHPIYV